MLVDPSTTLSIFCYLPNTGSLINLRSWNIVFWKGGDVYWFTAIHVSQQPSDKLTSHAIVQQKHSYALIQLKKKSYDPA